jgi:hypothetical protein
MKVVLIISLEWFPNLVARIRQLPDVLVTNNYEQLKGLVRENVVEKICVVIGGYNNSNSPCNTIEGYQAAKEIHEINSKIPMLIVDGEQTEVSPDTQMRQKVSVDTPTERYVHCGDYRKDFKSGKLFEDFFTG